MSTARTYPTRIGSQSVDLPLVPVSDDCTIALLICVDLGVHFAEVAGGELAELLAPARPELVVSVATMGIPLAIEVSRALGLDDYLILHKTPKIHLGESLAEPVRSITTDHAQMLRMDPDRVEVVRGRRVAVVDDVLSTGASMAAALSLVRRVGGDPVAIGVLMTEGQAWRETLGSDRARVVSLGSVPLFRPDPPGPGLREEWAPPGTSDSHL
jgi:adenine/guanine phosphoribosyltransferase-like PRPP-binding protein